MTLERPGSKVLTVSSTHRKLEDFRTLWIRYRRNKAAVVGLCLLSVMIGLAVFGPSMAPYNPFEFKGDPFIPPGAQFLMGTDHIGRDVFSGFLFGARISLLIGVLSALTAAGTGILVGSLSGYFGGSLDHALMRLTELFQVVPRFFFALMITALFGASFYNIIVVIGILSWPSVARLVRAEFLSLREREFVLAVKGLGAKTTSIIFREILPNALTPVVVVFSLEIANAIILESMLSFLGMGDPTAFSWGYMLNTAQAYLRLAWWLAAMPGFGILLTVLAFNLTGDGLNDALNPRLREV